ncbi:MAG: alkaline phosphatase family protein [Nitrospirota bacterium]|nr:alkaline phosphatase family protein [Nitrospirota bacterium]
MNTPSTQFPFCVGTLFVGVAAVLGFSLINPMPVRSATTADHVILVVLEGVGNASIHGGAMPTLNRLAKEGAVSWSAQTITPPFPVSAMASLLTGVPVSKHRVDYEWEKYDFSRAFLRAPTVFDYLDLSAGMDTALFLMDVRFYQLSRPEIYVDMQVCGKSKPKCNPNLLVLYIQDYLRKVKSEGGHGFRLIDIPGLLVAHMPAAADAGNKRGWNSKAYHKALTAVDTAIGDLLDVYREFEVLDKTMLIVTGLTEANSPGRAQLTAMSTGKTTVPWVAWGANVKPHFEIARKVSIMDTGATIMEALGLVTHTEWDSKGIHEIFQVVPEHRTTGNEVLAR